MEIAKGKKKARLSAGNDHHSPFNSLLSQLNNNQMANVIFTLVFLALLAVVLFYILNLFSTSFTWNAIVAVLLSFVAYIGFKAWRKVETERAFENFRSFIEDKINNKKEGKRFIKEFAQGLDLGQNKNANERREALQTAMENFINFLMKDEGKSEKEAKREVGRAFRDWRTAIDPANKKIYYDYIMVMGDGHAE